MLEYSVYIRHDFSPLESFGIVCNQELFEYEELVGMSVFKSAITTLTSYKKMVIDNSVFLDVKLSAIHHYCDFQRFVYEIEEKLKAKTVFCINQKNIGLLLLRKL